MSEEIVPVPIADGTVRRLFADPEFRVAKRGYHPDDVAAFLADFGDRTLSLISRLQGAETTTKATQAELDDYRHRAEQAESSRELFTRTLALAEETADAAVEDAKARGSRIETEAQQDSQRMIDETRLRIERMMDAARADVHRVYADERQSIAEHQSRVRAEGDQLETLRLAVAAESMALEEVRNELRRRIRRVATDLLGVAESPDCLGTPVTRGIPEVVASRTSNQVEQESSVPAGDEADGSTDELSAASSRQLTSGPDGADHQAPATDPDAQSIDLVETEGDGHDDEVTVVPEEPVAAEPGDAFDRFMSAEIEEEPSRTWILT